jgi:hypothetical protein
MAEFVAKVGYNGRMSFGHSYIAVELGCTTSKRLALMHGATCSELLSARAAVDVSGRIISKIAAPDKAD